VIALNAVIPGLAQREPGIQADRRRPIRTLIFRSGARRILIMIGSRASSQPPGFQSSWRDIVMMANAARNRETAAPKLPDMAGATHLLSWPGLTRPSDPKRAVRPSRSPGQAR
jgi:hypothetical protein